MLSFPSGDSGRVAVRGGPCRDPCCFPFRLLRFSPSPTDSSLGSVTGGWQACGDCPCFGARVSRCCGPVVIAPVTVLCSVGMSVFWFVGASDLGSAHVSVLSMSVQCPCSLSIAESVLGPVRAQYGWVSVLCPGGVQRRPAWWLVPRLHRSLLLVCWVRLSLWDAAVLAFWKALHRALSRLEIWGSFPAPRAAGALWRLVSSLWEPPPSSFVKFVLVDGVLLEAGICASWVSCTIVPVGSVLSMVLLSWVSFTDSVLCPGRVQCGGVSVLCPEWVQRRPAWCSALRAGWARWPAVGGSWRLLLSWLFERPVLEGVSARGEACSGRLFVFWTPLLLFCCCDVFVFAAAAWMAAFVAFHDIFVFSCIACSPRTCTGILYYLSLSFP